MTDSSGVVKYRSEFDPYGQTVMSWAASGDTSINSRRFAGYERDVASGLDYANARMYNSGRARFMQPDPLGLKAANLKKPQSLNLYSYAANDPVNFIDVTGLKPRVNCMGAGMSLDGGVWNAYDCWTDPDWSFGGYTGGQNNPKGGKSETPKQK